VCVCVVYDIIFLKRHYVLEYKCYILLSFHMWDYLAAIRFEELIGMHYHLNPLSVSKNKTPIY
jgi:hypothetical protein